MAPLPTTRKFRDLPLPYIQNIWINPLLSQNASPRMIIRSALSSQRLKKLYLKPSAPALRTRIAINNNSCRLKKPPTRGLRCVADDRFTPRFLVHTQLPCFVPNFVCRQCTGLKYFLEFIARKHNHLFLI